MKVMMAEDTSIFSTTAHPCSGVILRGIAGITLAVVVFGINGNLKVNHQYGPDAIFKNMLETCCAEMIYMYVHVQYMKL